MRINKCWWMVVCGAIVLSMALPASAANSHTVYTRSVPDENGPISSIDLFGNVHNYSMKVPYTIETNKAVYSIGETVNVVHRIVNDSPFPVGIELQQTPGFDLKIAQGEEIIWQRFNGYSTNITNITIQPGESLERHYFWDLTNWNTGALVSSGKYEVTGVIYGDLDVSVGITVVPELKGIWVFVLLGASLAMCRKR